jgi:uncharacterized membrane protein (Fun14 family)
VEWTWLPDIGAPFVVIALAAGLLIKVAKAVAKVVFGLVIVFVLLYLVASQGLIDLPFTVPTLSEMWERLAAGPR